MGGFLPLDGRLERCRLAAQWRERGEPLPPIATYSSRRWPAVVALVVILLPASCADLFAFHERRNITAGAILPLAILAIFTVLPIFGLISLITQKRSSITVDREGVTVIREGRTARYEFLDLEAVRTPTVDQRSSAKILKLVRKGELVDRDGPVGGIYGNFGTDTLTIAQVIQSAKDAWDKRRLGKGTPGSG